MAARRAVRGRRASAFRKCVQKMASHRLGSLVSKAGLEPETVDFSQLYENAVHCIEGWHQHQHTVVDHVAAKYILQRVLPEWNMQIKH